MQRDIGQRNFELCKYEVEIVGRGKEKCSKT